MNCSNESTWLIARLLDDFSWKIFKSFGVKLSERKIMSHVRFSRKCFINHTASLGWRVFGPNGTSFQVSTDSPCNATTEKIIWIFGLLSPFWKNPYLLLMSYSLGLVIVLLNSSNLATCEWRLKLRWLINFFSAKNYQYPVTVRTRKKKKSTISIVCLEQ